MNFLLLRRIQRNWVSHLFVKCLVFSIVNKLNIPIFCERWSRFKYAGEALREEPFFKVAFWKRRVYQLTLTEGIHPGWCLPHPGGSDPPVRPSETGEQDILFIPYSKFSQLWIRTLFFMIRCHSNDYLLIHNTFANYTSVHVCYGVNRLLGPSIPW